jgi:hypothetical protein
MKDEGRRMKGKNLQTRFVWINRALVWKSILHPTTSVKSMSLKVTSDRVKLRHAAFGSDE